MTGSIPSRNLQIVKKEVSHLGCASWREGAQKDENHKNWGKGKEKMGDYREEMQSPWGG
jgi:hypothetical protein